VEFLAWLASLEALQIPVWNPLPLLRWNLNKRYLEDLEGAGVPIAPTGWIEQGGLVHLDQILDLEGWKEVVIKPVVSAGADNTWALHRSEAQERDMDFRLQVQAREMMVQKLLPEIRTDGEISLCFFNGKYSHAVRKRPASGDFRVQTQHGGETEAFLPEACWVDQARAILDHVQEDWLYARVDGVRQGKTLILMELELLEPCMYLSYDAAAPERFARALLARLG
jgi:glutathione synthase/RimK-type ligase-like ATP-grasp enzyme